RHSRSDLVCSSWLLVRGLGTSNQQPRTTNPPTRIDMKFFEAVANVFRIPDLRKRILFTLAMLAVYRLGGHIPTPGIDANQLQKFFEQNQGTIFGFVDLFSGGMLRRLTVFA